MHVLLAPYGAEERLERLILDVIAGGRRRSAQLAGGLARPEKTPSQDIQKNLRAVLTQFVHGPIAKMTAIVPLIRQAMP